MSLRNRYRIAAANGDVLLTVPLVQGRNQRTPMHSVRIDNRSLWQRTQWRTLVSAYRRAPFFEHYEPLLQPLFETEYELLTDFCTASIHWVKAQLRLSFGESFADTFEKEPLELEDNRDEVLRKKDSSFLPYQQVFQDRYGFLPNLSVLDALFTEGPHVWPLLVSPKEKEM